MAAPLDDIRIVEFAQVIAIPVGMQILRSLGAEVVKVEPPTGDAIRESRSSGVSGEGRLFLIHNRGKKSVTLDLGHPDAQEVVHELVRSADVVATSFKRSDLPRYGLSYEQLKEVKPDLVYLENTPYGPEGPLKDMGGYDPVVGGLSGTSFLAAADVRGAPRLVTPAMSDFGTAFLAALGVVAAVRHRDRTGEGQRVETSLLATASVIGSQALNWIDGVDADRIASVQADLETAQANGAGFDEQRGIWERSFRPDRAGDIYFRHYRCRDGFITVACLSGGLRAKLDQLLPMEDPRRRDDWDPEAGGAAAEIQNYVLAVEEHFAAQTCGHWLTLLTEQGVPCGPFTYAEDALDHPQFAANDYLTRVEHPRVGSLLTYAPPVRISGNETGPLPPSPALGEHTDDILAGLGFDDDAVSRLRDSGALG